MTINNYVELKITEITAIDERTNKQNNTYIRATFYGYENKDAKTFKMSLSKKQFNEFLDKNPSNLNPDTGNLVLIKPIVCFVDPNSKSTSGKKMYDEISGIYNRKEFNYINLHVGLFIQNSLVSTDKFDKNLERYLINKNGQ